MKAELLPQVSIAPLQSDPRLYDMMISKLVDPICKGKGNALQVHLGRLSLFPSPHIGAHSSLNRPDTAPREAAGGFGGCGYFPEAV